MNKFTIAVAVCGAFSLGSIAHAQDAAMSSTTSTTTEMSTSMAEMPMAEMPISEMPMVAMTTTVVPTTPTITVIRRYIDSAGNLSAVDVRFSSGMGTGETRQLRISPSLVKNSEAAAPYGLGRTLTVALTDAAIMAPPSFDPDASMDMMRGVIAPVGNTTPGLPSLGLTNEEMLAGGYKSGKEPMMDKKMMEGKNATK